MAVLLAVLIGLGWGPAPSGAQQNDNHNDEPGTQVLTRGPVHEAFAGIITFNAEPGVVVTKAPPEPVEEMPPEERPTGDNVTWIPGYWAWDDERSDFLWVSGTWRALPPGRAWMAGYWGRTSQGYQWTSGYWADATVQETTYLPPPPATVEVGPNIAPPSPDYRWSPGCWIWHQDRYAWRPGYWALGRVDWDWTPAHYVWSPRGYIFIDGFWDYPVQRRGVLFAPVYLETAVYARRGYHFSPRIAIDLSVFTDHLFLRPSYHHYYFGDYYAPSYSQVGFHASFSFHSSRRGYDPIHSHLRWEHRHDREWGRRAEVSYQNRRDHEAARPPRTWAAHRTPDPRPAASRPSRVVMAEPIEQLAKRKDASLRFQPVAQEERQRLSKRGQEVQISREQRRTLEAGAADAPARAPGEAVQPTRAPLPSRPIVARPASQMERKQAPPEVQRAPRPDPKVQPNSRPAGPPPDAIKTNPRREPRQIEPDRKAPPGRSEARPERSRGQEKKAERIAEPARTRGAPAEVEKGAARLLKKPGKGKPAPPADPRVPAPSGPGAG